MNREQWERLSPNQKKIVVLLLQKYEVQKKELLLRGSDLRHLKLAGYDETGRKFVEITFYHGVKILL